MFVGYQSCPWLSELVSQYSASVMDGISGGHEEPRINCPLPKGIEGVHLQGVF